MNICTEFWRCSACAASVRAIKVDDIHVTASSYHVHLRPAVLYGARARAVNVHQIHTHTTPERMDLGVVRSIAH